MYNPLSFHTAESVAQGHPDKVCDQISDAILDEYLRQDPNSRVAAEVFGTNGLLVIGGEVTSEGKVGHELLAHNLYRSIGYDEDLKIIDHVTSQSPDIAQGVDTGGAGDQGIMYGFATNETPEMLPRASVLVHKLMERLKSVRQTPEFSWLGPDGKSQVTMDKGEIKTVLVSVQHTSDKTAEEVREAIIEQVIIPVVGHGDYEILVNPTGKFVLGGFTADAGLTGRKIMVDTYNGLAPHGGGAFSGKDPTKVDRSAAYMSRYVAKNAVAQGLGKSVLVSVAYAIGKADPLMVSAINDVGANLSNWAQKNFDFRPKAIIEQLNLRRPIYQPTAAFGHFGRDGFSWEEV